MATAILSKSIPIDIVVGILVRFLKYLAAHSTCYFSEILGIPRRFKSKLVTKLIIKDESLFSIGHLRLVGNAKKLTKLINLVFPVLFHFSFFIFCSIMFR